MDRGSAVVLTAVAGGLIACQAPINSRLGKVAGTFPAATISFAIGLVILVGITAVAGDVGRLGRAVHVPWWYLLGGVLGAVYVSTVLVSVRTLGAGGVTAATIAGQLSAAVAIDHFGWLGVARQPVTALRVLGIALLAVGVFLVVRD
jgi:bacterial/archaeal transporter family-2 protein